MKIRLLSPLPFFLTLALNWAGNHAAAQDPGILKISFINTVKGDRLRLDSTTYTNPFTEQYTVSKFKYYVSNVTVTFPLGAFAEKDSYHLIDERDPASLAFGFSALAGTYQSLLFTLGVDSIRNVSGAQTGALDPLNDMFWTWNTGYVMAKMEGNSPQSKIINNKIEFHVGGFSGANNVLKNIMLNFPAGNELVITAGKTTEVIIGADLDKWWQQPFDLKISNNAICTTPGPLARKIADNYGKMFSIKRVINNN